MDVMSHLEVINTRLITTPLVAEQQGRNGRITQSHGKNMEKWKICWTGWVKKASC